MSSKKHTYKRKKHLVKKNFQLQFILKFCLVILAGVVISTSLLFFFSQGTLTSSFQNSRLVIQTTGAAILPSVIYTNLITLALISTITVFITLFISHKVAGPIYRFEREIQDIARGDLSKIISLRESDQVHEMAEGLNQMSGSLREKMIGIWNEVENLQASSARQKLPETIIEEIEKLKQTIRTNFRL